MKGILCPQVVGFSRAALDIFAERPVCGPEGRLGGDFIIDHNPGVAPVLGQFPALHDMRWPLVVIAFAETHYPISAHLPTRQDTRAMFYHLLLYRFRQGFQHFGHRHNGCSRCHSCTSLPNLITTYTNCTRLCRMGQCGLMVSAYEFLSLQEFFNECAVRSQDECNRLL